MTVNYLHPDSIMAMAMGAPVFLGVVAYTASSVNNHDTGAPFNDTGDALKGKVLLIQVSTACSVYFGSSNAAAATTANGIYLNPNERAIVYMSPSSGWGWIAAIRDTASGNLRVWELIA